MSFDTLPDGWRIWNEDPGGRTIVVFRPDVFDGSSFSAECLPTIYVTNGSRRRRPGAGQYATDEWHVVLFMEPEIEVTSETYGAHSEAVDGAVALAERFVAGDIEYRDMYQIPRDAYFERLDELTGR